MQLLDQLRGVSVDGLQLDEAVALLSFGKVMQEAYVATVTEAPEWLKESVEALEKEVRSRHRDALERRLKEIDAREAALKTAEEKRADLKDERARLLAALNKPSV